MSHFVRATCNAVTVGIKEQVKKQLDAKFPEKEAHLPENQRQGYIPDAVWKAIQQSLRECPGASHTGVHQKNATPAEAPTDLNAVIETIRPSVLLPDRDCRKI